jgi:hypothetical protein
MHVLIFCKIPYLSITFFHFLQFNIKQVETETNVGGEIGKTTKNEDGEVTTET